MPITPQTASKNTLKCTAASPLTAACQDPANPFQERLTQRFFSPSRRATIACLSALLPLLFLWGCASREEQRISGLATVAMDARTAQHALQGFYKAWQGVPYRNGGTTKQSVDCSGLMVVAYRDIYGLRLPRTVEDQARYGVTIPPEKLQPGDLLFFKTGIFQEHVGISLDSTRFIHASATKGVMLSRLDEPYWQNAFWKANRLFSYSHSISR